jgi:2,4-dienoyl-CoA reductase-like NADH-dependent reductase (Old Yellow Enzyme family)
VVPEGRDRAGRRSVTSSGLAPLLTPIRLGPVVVPNRIIRSGAGTGFELATATTDFVEYHRARAHGGVGLLVAADTRIHPSTGGALRTWGDDAEPGLALLADAIHGEGSVVFQMLSHQGASAATGEPPWSASAVPDPVTGAIPVSMTVAMIDEVVAAFASAARRCRDAGMDGVEIHAGHGFLVSQFLSPLTNRRDDDYGGTLDNRARLLRRILAAVRAEAGPGLAVGVRVSAEECLPGGIEVGETKALVRELERADLVDFVDVSLGHLWAYPSIIGAMHELAGYQLTRTREVTAVCATPTIVAGRITSLYQAAGLVADGTADLVSLLRATVADPDLVRKTVDGRAAEVRPCVACNECFRAVTVERRIACAVNPRAVPPHPGTSQAPRRRVVVIGGGPAGCEAAHVAAAAGHDVVLFESGPTLGGALRTAAVAPHRSEFARLADWYGPELERLGVEVRTSTIADPGTVLGLQPDQVIVATGARARHDGVQQHRPAHRPPGVELPHVHTVDEVHSGGGQGSVHAVVVDDLGSYEAVGVAEQLAAQGTPTVIVTPFDGPAHTLGVTLERDPARRRLQQAGVQWFGGLVLDAIDTQGVDLVDLDGGQPLRLPCDLLVLVTGYQPVRDLVADLESAGLAVSLAGDAATPGRLRDATSTGQQAVLDFAPDPARQPQLEGKSTR